MIETRGGNNYNLTHLPVHSSHKINLSVSCIGCLRQFSPGDISRLSMHIESTTVTTNDFVPEARKLFIVVVAVKNKCELMFVRSRLSTSLEHSVLDYEVVGLHHHI